MDDNSNQKNPQDESVTTEAAPDGSKGEELLSISELLEEDEEMANEAEALLGGIDDESCSYADGYKPRQPLYSCRTCAEKSGQTAGICFACSLHCHDGHDLVEMYTKRKFCCDCGNSRFKDDFKCKLFAEKIPINALNSYNHNFNGLYCVCKKPYPPEEGDETYGEEMHQCVVCEDWFHHQHITHGEGSAEEAEKASREEYGEMVCEQCVGRLPFLMAYQTLDAHDVSTAGQCKLTAFRTNSASSTASTPKTLSLGQGWRKTLCRCGDCSKRYESADCIFLLDEEDTMQHYDAKKQENMEKKDAAKGSLESEMYNFALRQTDSHDAALYVYMATKQMQQHLGEFIRSHGQTGKAFTIEDVHKCFEELSAKRPKPDEFMAFQNGHPGGDDDSVDPM